MYQFILYLCRSELNQKKYYGTTVYIDDTTTAGKRFINENQRSKKGVEFTNTAVADNIPNGYMSGEDFEKRVKAELMELCRSAGTGLCPTKVIDNE